MGFRYAEALEEYFKDLAGNLIDWATYATLIWYTVNYITVTAFMDSDLRVQLQHYRDKLNACEASLLGCSPAVNPAMKDMLTDAATLTQTVDRFMDTVEYYQVVCQLLNASRRLHGHMPTSGGEVDGFIALLLLTVKRDVTRDEERNAMCVCVSGGDAVRLHRLPRVVPEALLAAALVGPWCTRDTHDP